MSTFERIYHTDPSREQKIETESKTIELSDKEYLERATAYFNRLPKQEVISPELREKFEKSQQFTTHVKIGDSRGKDEKGKSKSIKTKPKKNNTKSNKSAMAGV